MGANDKAREAMEETKGKLKEGWGELTNDQKLQTEGRADQARAKAEEVETQERDRLADEVGDGGIENR